MKKYMILVVCLGLLLFSCQTNNDWLTKDLGQGIYSLTNTKEASSVNPVKGDFPGGRGPNDLVVYTPEFGERTGTNEWGIEAVVDNGYIISIGGNNSLIPENGLVISGNELASQWINNNLTVGMKVDITENTINYVKSENTSIYRARVIYAKILKRIDEKKIDFNDQLSKCNEEVAELFKQFCEAKNNENVDDARVYSTQILKQVQNLFYQTFSPKKGEFRGVWIRLNDKTPEQLKNTIKRMADAGINAILPETVYNGYSIYPNAHQLMPQLPQFEGWDPMAVMIEECKKYNIKVIPWCEMFFIGGKNSPIAKKKPEWLGKFRTGKTAAVLEPGFQYLCPSRPEVHKFLLEILDTLLTRYDLSEIQLDYIRYSLSEPWEKGACYCDFCQKKVKKQNHFDIKKITPENKNEWKQWNEYRINNITTFVAEVNDLVQKKHPNVDLSADVFPNPQISLTHKFQDWKSWVDKSMIDVVYIMTYSVDNKTVHDDSKSMIDILKGSSSEGVVGLGPYMGFQPDVLLEQIEIARSYGAKGVCLFSFNALNEEQINALKVGPFRKL